MAIAIHTEHRRIPDQSVLLLNPVLGLSPSSSAKSESPARICGNGHSRDLFKHSLSVPSQGISSSKTGTYSLSDSNVVSQSSLFLTLLPTNRDPLGPPSLLSCHNKNLKKHALRLKARPHVQHNISLVCRSATNAQIRSMECQVPSRTAWRHLHIILVFGILFKIQILK